MCRRFALRPVRFGRRRGTREGGVGADARGDAASARGLRARPGSVPRRLTGCVRERIGSLTEGPRRAQDFSRFISRCVCSLVNVPMCVLTCCRHGVKKFRTNKVRRCAGERDRMGMAPGWRSGYTASYWQLALAHMGHATVCGCAGVRACVCVCGLCRIRTCPMPVGERALATWSAREAPG